MRRRLNIEEFLINGIGTRRPKVSKEKNRLYTQQEHYLHEIEVCYKYQPHDSVKFSRLIINQMKHRPIVLSKAPH
jgi:hypothetical protein